ncbi:MAG TPA: cobalt ECF transporter T component CbiQ [Acidimicrobiia bacterium]|jgi:cobalt/nickel transport system permease protein|nr:cobalt ECF transporter T component CbiQ [Acidimicrobiia bacterium]
MGAGHTHALYVHEHSPIHRLPPQVKIAAAVLFVFSVAVTPREAIWAFAGYAVAIAALSRISRVGLHFLLIRLVGVVPFIAFAFLIPFIASGQQVEVLGISVSQEGLQAAWNIIAKATIGASTSILLAGTTEIPDILAGMARLKVPVVFTSIAGFMIRYLGLIVDEIGRMRVAMTARGYDPRWLWQAKPIAQSAGAMFIRSYERGERVHDAMVARGYRGEMPELRRREPTVREWLLGAMLPLFGISVMVAAMVTT